MKSTILIYSGGLDSTVLLARLVGEGREVKALSIDYGQRHVRELLAAAKICTLLGVEHRVADLSSLKPFLAGSSQTDASVPVPHGHYAEENMRKTVVPFRNGLMLSCAAAWAISTKADTIAYAAHAGDHAVYPDCRDEFCSAFNTVTLLADWHQVTLERPFVHLTKAQIVKIGIELEAPFELTWSCYEGESVSCGRCGTCSERLLAFDEAGAADPLQYADREFYKTLK